MYIHLEAPDECGHQGDPEGKKRSLELIDEKIIGYVKARLDESGEDYKFMVLPDHPTPVSIKTHSGESIPCVMYRKGEDNKTGFVYSEACAEKHGQVRTVGHELMREFLS